MKFSKRYFVCCTRAELTRFLLREAPAKHDPRGAECFEDIDKWDFYKKTQEKSTVVIMSSESALYANNP